VKALGVLSSHPAWTSVGAIAGIVSVAVTAGGGGDGASVPDGSAKPSGAPYAAVSDAPRRGEKKKKPSAPPISVLGTWSGVARDDEDPSERSRVTLRINDVSSSATNGGTVTFDACPPTSLEPLGREGRAFLFRYEVWDMESACYSEGTITVERVSRSSVRYTDVEESEESASATLRR
jgi:hypothetical protein